MFGPAVVVSALAAAVVAWGVPPGVPRPRIFEGAPDAPSSVQGTLDKEVIRGVIRSHIDEVKQCYEQELPLQPGLRGRIMVQFTIAASGQVIASVLQNSTMGNARVENCTVQAVRRWEFPHPPGGSLVIVSYPFVLTPDGSDGAQVAIPPNAPRPPLP